MIRQERIFAGPARPRPGGQPDQPGVRPRDGGDGRRRRPDDRGGRLQSVIDPQARQGDVQRLGRGVRQRLAPDGQGSALQESLSDAGGVAETEPIMSMMPRTRGRWSTPSGKSPTSKAAISRFQRAACKSGASSGSWRHQLPARRQTAWSANGEGRPGALRGVAKSHAEESRPGRPRADRQGYRARPGRGRSESECSPSPTARAHDHPNLRATPSRWRSGELWRPGRGGAWPSGPPPGFRAVGWRRRWSGLRVARRPWSRPARRSKTATAARAGRQPPRSPRFDRQSGEKGTPDRRHFRPAMDCDSSEKRLGVTDPRQRRRDQVMRS